MYWVIKHGIKTSAMPAWGRTHSDARIWAMVAFIKQLPTLNPEQYLDLVAVPPSSDEPTEHAPAASEPRRHHNHAEHRDFAGTTIAPLCRAGKWALVTVVHAAWLKL
jgi:hypothetical protein